MRIGNDKILDGYAASASFVSGAFSLKHMIGCLIQAAFVGGSPAGTLTLEVSADNGENGPPPSTWATLKAPVDSTTSVSGVGVYDWNVSNQFGKWIRVRYAGGTGTSTVTITVNSKGV